MTENSGNKKRRRKKQYSVSAEDLRRLVRCEFTWTDIVGKSGCDEKDLAFDESYSPDMNDWAVAVSNLREKKADWKAFANWFQPFVYNEELRITLGLPDEPVDVLLPVGEAYVAEDLYSEMLRAFLEYDDSNDLDELVPFQDAFPFEDLLGEVRYFREGKDKPVQMRKYTDRSKLAFVRQGSDNEIYRKFPESLKTLCRRMADELCDKGVAEVLEIRGYCSYEGGGLYPADWVVSRDSLKAAFEKEPKPYLANSLGYIAYYGRCNRGVPQYDEAFRWFSIGAAGGNQESRYKLGDMFLNGYGVPKMAGTAVRLYKEVYDETKQELCSGETDGKFADAALRLAGVAKMAGPGFVPLWYRYALEADYAIRLRLPSDQYGDSSVFAHIQDELAESARTFHMAVKKTNVLRHLTPEVLMRPINNYRRCLKAVFHRTTETKARLTVFAMNQAAGDPIETYKMLLVVPDADYCRLQDKIIFELRSVGEVHILGDSDSFYYNYVFWNSEKKGFVFCHDEDVTAFIGAKEVVWKAPGKKENVNSRMLHFVTVRFSEAGRGYDYLCDDDSVKVGDHVIVPGHDGETEVEVIKVFDCRESETALPLDHYKSVIRKCE
ncbi:MAG: hypothetical protein ACOX78_04150 [Lachnospiraceae bacterium]|jgi:hypothetical protein